MTANNLADASHVTTWWDDDTIVPLRRSVAEWRSIVLDAYVVQPTLSLTTQQGQRLWGMDAPTCTYVLDSLVDARVLARTAEGQYCRPEFVGAVEVSGIM
jgi:hypothetical protein